MSYGQPTNRATVRKTIHIIWLIGKLTRRRFILAVATATTVACNGLYHYRLWCYGYGFTLCITLPRAPAVVKRYRRVKSKELHPGARTTRFLIVRSSLVNKRFRTIHLSTLSWGRALPVHEAGCFSTVLQTFRSIACAYQFYLGRYLFSLSLKCVVLLPCVEISKRSFSPYSYYMLMSLISAIML